MTKKNILSALGVILSFFIAIGGWVLTGYLIEAKSDKLLAVTMDIATNPLESVTAGGDAPHAKQSLTENEILAVLENWSWKNAASLRETPHEPTDEQLTMEQAVEAAREWLSFIGGLHVFPDEALNFGNVSAYLAQKLSPEPNNHFMPPMYSYWEVSFTNDSMSVALTINAVTGQVWQTYINIYRTDIILNGYDITDALTAFTSVFDLDFGGSGELFPFYVDSGIFNAMLNFADGKAVAAVTAHGLLLEDGRLAANNFLMHLIVN